MTDLRASLHQLADSTDPLPVDDGLWRRARTARRRAQAVVLAATLAIVATVTWTAVTIDSDGQEARTASQAVPGGAIPSRIEDPGPLPLEEDLAVGRASVAFLSSAGQAVVVDATDGSYHALELPDAPEDGGLVSLSPDGRYLAWSNHGRIHDLQLEDGRVGYFGSEAEHAVVTGLRWPPRSDQLLWDGTDEGGAVTGGVLPAGAGSGLPLPTAALRGIPSPTDDLVAVASEGRVGAAPFVGLRGKETSRALPGDLYPDGATVRPLGWTQPDLVLAEVDAPAGSYVEGRHLALFTSPDRPESEWTYRIVLRDLPALDVSVAVDLVPDLDGTSSQELTHDFTTAGADPQAFGGIEASLVIGLGVAAAIAFLMALRLLWRRVRTQM